MAAECLNMVHFYKRQCRKRGHVVHVLFSLPIVIILLTLAGYITMVNEGRPIYTRFYSRYAIPLLPIVINGLQCPGYFDSVSKYLTLITGV